MPLNQRNQKHHILENETQYQSVASQRTHIHTHTHTYIHTHTYTYIFTRTGGTRAEMVIVVGNGHDDTSSNHRQG